MIKTSQIGAISAMIKETGGGKIGYATRGKHNDCNKRKRKTHF